MSRRVPEFALVTGLLLGLSTLVSGVVLAGDVVGTSLVAAFVSYPFVAYAVVCDVDSEGDGDGPTTVMPPRAVLAAGGLFGSALVAVSLFEEFTVANALFGLFAGLLVSLPPAAYAVHFEAEANPLDPRATVLVGVAVGAALLLAGLLSGAAAYGAADAFLVALSAAMYGRVRGVALDARTKRVAVAAGGLLGVAVLGVGIARNEPLGGWIAAAMALTLGPSVYYALTSGSESGRRRSRR